MPTTTTVGIFFNSDGDDDAPTFIGTLTLTATGAWTYDGPDQDFPEFLKGLVVLDGINGQPIPASSPDFIPATWGSIESQSGWTYLVQQT